MKYNPFDNAILKLISWYDMNTKIFYDFEYLETKHYYYLKDFKIYKKIINGYSVPGIDCLGITINPNEQYVVEHPLSPGKIALWGDIIIRQVTGDY